MTPEQASPPEFSRPLAADRIGRDGYAVTLEATPAECAALARRFGIVALDGLTARCRLRPVAGGMIELAAKFEAEVTQECVVTLEPFPARVAEEFTQRYALDPQRHRPRAAEDKPFDPEGEDPPEALQDGGIDLGEAVAQQLAVAIDPFPRAPGVAFPPGEEGPSTTSSTRLPAGLSTSKVETGDKPENGKRANPFAALSKLKK